MKNVKTNKEQNYEMKFINLEREIIKNPNGKTAIATSFILIFVVILILQTETFRQLITIYFRFLGKLIFKEITNKPKEVRIKKTD